MHIRIIFEIFEKYKCADIVFSSKALHMILVNLCAQLCPTLCNRMEMWPASLLCIWNFFFFFFLGVHGIFETGILEWIAISYSRGSFQPRNRTHVSCISCLTGRFFTTEPPGKPMCIYTYRYFRKLTDFMKNL